MTDKTRQRSQPAPHGSVPNWVLVIFGAASIAVIGLAQTLI